MNTAQVSIELVLAGILALCAFVLPFFPNTTISKDLLQSEALIGILGLAYLLGVIFDKLADTLIGHLEQYQRLEHAADYLNNHPNFKGKDPFPQSTLEFRLRDANDGRLEWMNSLKSRIRTSRELAVLGLPATMGIVLHLITQTWAYIPIALNLMIFIFSAWTESKLKLIKTDEVTRDEKIRESQITSLKNQAHILSIPYYLLMAISIIAIGMSAMLAPNKNPILLIGGGGLILALLALWTSLRISRTYINFVAREMPAFLKYKEKGE